MGLAKQSQISEADQRRRGQFIGKMGVVANRLLSATARGDGANFHRASRENGDQLAACRSEHNVPFLRVIE